jgi:hypothetical protein
MQAPETRLGYSCISKHIAPGGRASTACRTLVVDPDLSSVVARLSQLRRTQARSGPAPNAAAGYAPPYTKGPEYHFALPCSVPVGIFRINESAARERGSAASPVEEHLVAEVARFGPRRRHHHAAAVQLGHRLRARPPHRASWGRRGPCGERSRGLWGEGGNGSVARSAPRQHLQRRSHRQLAVRAVRAAVVR